MGWEKREERRHWPSLTHKFLIAVVNGVIRTVTTFKFKRADSDKQHLLPPPQVPHDFDSEFTVGLGRTCWPFGLVVMAATHQTS